MSDENKYNDDISMQEEEKGTAEELPKEIVQLLMKKHPIKSSEAKDDDLDRMSREEIRESRKQRLQEAEKEYKKLEEEVKLGHTQRNEYIEEELEEGVISQCSSKSSRSEESEEFDTKTLFDEDEDLVQLVRRTSRSGKKGGYRKGFNPSKVEEIDEIGKNFLEKEERKENPIIDRPARRPRRKSDEEKVEERYFDVKNNEETKKALDVFFDENEYYEDESAGINFKIVGILAGTVAVCLIAFLGFKTMSLSGQLSEASKTVELYDQAVEELDALKRDNLKLKEEAGMVGENNKDAENIGELPVDVVGAGEETPDNEVTSNVTTSVTSNVNTDNVVTADQLTGGGQSNIAEPAQKEEYTMYTVVDGDSPWTIAEKTLGNGTLSDVIMEANGLKEGDYVQPGQQLKIPKQN